MEKIIAIEEHQEDGKEGYMVLTTRQTIKLLIANGQSCCEDWGYFMSEDDFRQFIGADMIDISLTDTCLNTKKMNEVNEYGVSDVMFVNINTTSGLLQFVAYNDHNGYYGHSAYVFSEQLTHKTCL